MKEPSRGKLTSTNEISTNSINQKYRLESFASTDSVNSIITKQDIIENVINSINSLKSEDKLNDDQTCFQITYYLQLINKNIFKIIDTNKNTLLHILIKDQKYFRHLKLITKTYFLNSHSDEEFFTWFFAENNQNMTVLDLSSLYSNKQTFDYLYTLISKTNISKLNFTKNSKKNTLFYYAAKNNKIYSLVYWYEKLQPLFPSIKLIDISNDHKITPLHSACFNNSKECVDLLIDLGSNVNALDVDGKSVLTYAVYSDNESIIKKLLYNGADRKIKDKHNKTPYDYAISMDKFKIAKFLNEKTFKINNIKQNGNPYELILCLLLFMTIIFILVLRLSDIDNISKIMNNNLIALGLLFIGVSFIFNIACLLIASYFICCGKKKSEIKKEIKNNLINLLENNIEQYDICYKCLLYKKENSFHCLDCNQCIDEFKYHSYWLNLCINKKNIKIYLTFISGIFFMFASNITSDIFLICYAIKNYNSESSLHFFNNIFFLDSYENNKICYYSFISIFGVMLIISLIILIILLYNFIKKNKNDQNLEKDILSEDLKTGLINADDKEEKKTENKSSLIPSLDDSSSNKMSIFSQV